MSHLHDGMSFKLRDCWYAMVLCTGRVQVRDLQVEIAAISSQHAAALDSKRTLEDKQALMTQELNELRAHSADSSSAAAEPPPGQLPHQLLYIIIHPFRKCPGLLSLPCRNSRE